MRVSAFFRFSAAGLAVVPVLVLVFGFGFGMTGAGCGGDGSSPSSGAEGGERPPHPTTASSADAAGSDAERPATDAATHLNDAGGVGPPVPVLSAGLKVEASKNDVVPKVGSDSRVMVQCLDADSGGTTSLRFATNKLVDTNMFPVGAPNNNRVAPPSERRVQQRDRDLGQTFMTGAKGFTLGAVYLRIGFSDKAVVAGALGAQVALQVFEVSGSPTVNPSGTIGFLKDSSGKPVFDRSKSPQLDDYLDGESYRTVFVARGALPQAMAGGDYLTLTPQGGDPLVLSPRSSYGFALLFLARAQDRSIGLANAFFGSYAPDPSNALVGHGLRREGGSGPPESPFFRPDLPDDLTARLAQQPGTMGFPDVDTYRDLFFTITAAP